MIQQNDICNIERDKLIRQFTITYILRKYSVIISNSSFMNFLGCQSYFQVALRLKISGKQPKIKRCNLKLTVKYRLISTNRNDWRKELKLQSQFQNGENEFLLRKLLSVCYILTTDINNYTFLTKVFEILLVLSETVIELLTQKM